jgi:hypothetical protein
VFSQLRADGVKAGYVDLDQMWRNYRDAGARRLVVSGVVNTATEVKRYVDGLLVAEVARRVLEVARPKI